MAFKNGVFGNLKTKNFVFAKNSTMFKSRELDSSLCIACGYHLMFHCNTENDSLVSGMRVDPAMCKGAKALVFTIAPLPPLSRRGSPNQRRLWIAHPVMPPPPPLPTQASRSHRDERSVPPKKRKVNLEAWEASSSMDDE